jgi:RimJ/RimL family protein N-acetyltransferase
VIPGGAEDGVPPLSGPHEVRSARLLLRPLPPEAAAALAGVVAMGYSIVLSRRRRGYASEAAAALIAWALEEPSVEAVVAGTAAENLASQRVLESAGFTRTGEADGEIRWRLDRAARGR